jgi:hypothetical protein
MQGFLAKENPSCAVGGYDFWGGKSGLNPRRRASHRHQTVPLHDVIHPGHVGRPPAFTTAAISSKPAFPIEPGVCVGKTTASPVRAF